MIDCGSERERLIIQMYARLHWIYQAFACNPAADPTICLSPDRACQRAGQRQLPVIPPPVSCLCTTFEAVNIDPEEATDAASAAVAAAGPLLVIFFNLSPRQNYTCQLPSEDVPLRLTVAPPPAVVQCDASTLSQSVKLIVEN